MTTEADPHAPPATAGTGPLTSPSLRETLALVLEGTSVLFANGETTERTIAAGERIAGTHGYRSRVVARWDGLTVRLEDGAGARHDIVLVTPTGIDMYKVMEAERAVDAICARSLRPQEAARYLIRDRDRVYGPSSAGAGNGEILRTGMPSTDDGPDHGLEGLQRRPLTSRVKPASS